MSNRELLDEHIQACEDAAATKPGTPEHEEAMDRWSQTQVAWRTEFDKGH